jgi:hypothetical protein
MQQTRTGLAEYLVVSVQSSVVERRVSSRIGAVDLMLSVGLLEQLEHSVQSCVCRSNV